MDYTNYYLTFEYSLNNNGFMLKTHWLELGVDSQLIYLVVAVFVGLKIWKKLKPLEIRRRKK
jgi:hypothetical protein